MTRKYAFCIRCHEIITYVILDDGDTTFPRGEFLAHNDWITTGFDTREEAEAAMKQEPPHA